MVHISVIIIALHTTIFAEIQPDRNQQPINYGIYLF